MKTKLLSLLIFTFVFNICNSQTYTWQLLPNSPIPDSAAQRFEDVYFINGNTGWIAMYRGKVYKTTNGGNTWALVQTANNYPFANYRCLGFFDSQTGLLGTLNFAFPLFRTTNGGLNWTSVNNIPNPAPYGVCGISIVNQNVGYACGRYAAPAHVIKTTDKGATWSSIIMDTSLVRSLVDCYFWSADSGIVVGGYNTSSYTVGNAVVLITSNGGNTWQRVYRSNRSAEWCWKISFVSRDTGFVSIERHSGLSYIIKTTNRGFNWQEIVFLNYDQEGIGFINENTGWVGGWTGPTYKTTNGGSTWSQAYWGYFVNRFRFLNDTLAYAVGDRVYKYLPAPVETQRLKIAAIGDYGKAGTNEYAVSYLVNNWNPDVVITLGNNNYDFGEEKTIDSNIGQYYNQFIYPYMGDYTDNGDSVNRFFPSLGSVDWITQGGQPYYNYFVLPGNERYYDFVKENVHFYCINSEPNEPDGRDSNSVQAQWLKNKLAQSTEKWNIVYFNQSPYSSGSTYGSESIMQWPFKSWGATAVLSGREHIYERLFIDQLPYFVNGLGGESIYPLGTPITGSVVRYNGNYGAMLMYSYDDSLVFKFFNIAGSLIDSYKILQSPKTLTLRAVIEGYYNLLPNPKFGTTVSVYLRNVFPPYVIVDSIKSFVNSTGTGVFYFYKASNATDYYLVHKHENSLETWSATGNRFTLNSMNYDFTTSDTQAYGNNLIQIDKIYCIYSGDVNQDQIIDGDDFSQIDNAAYAFTSGNAVEDLNGDRIVDAEDLSYVDNNSYNFVGLIRP